MKVTRPLAFFCAVGLLAGPSGVCLAATAPASVLSPAAYRAELDRLLAAVDRADVPAIDLEVMANDLPPAWRVQDGPRNFDISTTRVRNDLRAMARTPGAGTTAHLRAQLRRLHEDLDAYDAAPRDTTRDRAGLAAILARPEFSGVHGPTWFDRLKQAALTFLVSWLERAVSSSNIPTIGRIVVYALVALALAVAALWIYRSLRRTAKTETILPDELPVSAKEWTAWLAEARAASERAAWRDAVHLAYWAAIAFLESRRLWPPDRARTPREYLRLLPAASEHRSVLAALTHTFELVWYGHHDADAGTFSRAVAELEKLGCHSS